MNIEIITSTQNKKYKQLAGLHQKKNRLKEHLFIIEGKKEITSAIQSGYELISIWVTKEQQDYVDTLKIDLSQCAVYQFSKALYAKVGYREKTEGILAVARMKDEKTLSELTNPRGLYIICEGIEKPGNLGAIFRIVDGAGASGIILMDPLFDLYNPNVIRNSVGTFFNLPVYQAEDNQQITSWCSRHQIKLVVATPESDYNYWEVDFPHKSAVLVGREHAGVSEYWKKDDLIRIKIPMLGQNDSLNLSVSTGVVVYEWLRQNKKSRDLF